jgi:predicted small secreted protein
MIGAAMGLYGLALGLTYCSPPHVARIEGEGMVRLLFLLGCVGVVTALVACNTVAGAGNDISDSAHWVQHRL